ncbi:MAG: hypothetical protein AB8B80_00355 [Marinicellaceae bacterium]
MSEVLFDVVFKGKFTNKINKEKAILHFSKLFKLSHEKATVFFDGKARTLKKALPMDKASHFRAALKKAGLRVSLSKIQEAESEQSKNTMTMAEPGAILANKPFIQPKNYDANQFDLDEVGVTLVKYFPVEKKQYDLKNFQVDEVGSIMDHKPEIPVPELDISNLTLDEVGAVFAEKQDVEPPLFDFEDLDLEEPGKVLPQPEKPKKPEIDTSDFELVE